MFKNIFKSVVSAVKTEATEYGKESIEKLKEYYNDFDTEREFKKIKKEITTMSQKLIKEVVEFTSEEKDMYDGIKFEGFTFVGYQKSGKKLSGEKFTPMFECDDCKSSYPLFSTRSEDNNTVSFYLSCNGHNIKKCLCKQ